MKSRHGEIIKVADLFEKYKKVLKAPQSSVVKEVIEVIADITGVTLSPKYIKYAVHSRTISITAFMRSGVATDEPPNFKIFMTTVF